MDDSKRRLAKLWCKACGLIANFEDAVAAAEIWLALEPDCAQALGYKGFAEFKLRDFGTALASLNRAQFAFGKELLDYQKTQAYRVEECIVECCSALGRELPLPPLVKFPRTSHAFRPQGSMAVTEDDIVLPDKDKTMLAM